MESRKNAHLTDEILLTISEAAVYLKITTHTFRVRICKGRIPEYLLAKIDGVRYVHKKEFLKWIESHFKQIEKDNVATL